MIHIPWKDRYNINYKEIDDQHRGLVAILNELVDCQGDVVDGDRVAGIFHRLCQYALTHFATEERYMTAAGYPGLAQHQTEHAAFINDLLALNQSYESSDPLLVEATFTFVKEWYLQHIIQSDLDYVALLKGYHARAPIHGIIFDLSGVVCRIDEARFLAAAATLCGRELKAVVEGQPSLFRGYETGLLDTQEFLAQFSALCGQEIPEADFSRAYADVFTPIDSTIELLQKLKGRYKLGLIADTTPLRYELGLRPLDLLPLFDAVTLPYEVKALKPDLAVFTDITTKLELMTEECIYVDDRPPLALAATGHLFHGIVGANAESLLANLRRLKVAV